MVDCGLSIDLNALAGLHLDRSDGTMIGQSICVMEDAVFILAQSMPTDNRNVWLALAITGIAVLWMTFRSMRSRRDPLANKPLRMNLSQQKSLERDMQNLLVELSSMARQMNAQLETRATKIELLIVDADKRIAELKRLGKSDASESSPAILPPSSRAIDAPVDLTRLGFHSSDSSKSRKLEESPSIESQFEPNIEPNIEPISTRHAEVYRLADEGLSAQQIAQRLSRPRGEIELLLALYRPVKEEGDEVELPKIAID